MTSPVCMHPAVERTLRFLPREPSTPACTWLLPHCNKHEESAAGEHTAPAHERRFRRRARDGPAFHCEQWAFHLAYREGSLRSGSPSATGIRLGLAGREATIGDRPSRFSSNLAIVSSAASAAPGGQSATAPLNSVRASVLSPPARRTGPRETWTAQTRSSL